MAIFLSILFFVGVPLLIAWYIYVKIQERKLIEQVTPIWRGEWSERRVILKLLKMGINPKAIFHDLYLQKPNGQFAQIDVAVATKCGLIIFEVKDYGGWIFGNSSQKYWTQIMAYGREKHRFYNPIMQNQGHIHAIRERLPQNPGIPIYSVIVFFGRCELKDVTNYVDNTYVMYPNQIQEAVEFVLSHEPANFGNKIEIMDVFSKAVENGTNPQIREAHLNAAQFYGRNKPLSTYDYFRLSNIFSGFRKFW